MISHTSPCFEWLKHFGVQRNEGCGTGSVSNYWNCQLTVSMHCHVYCNYSHVLDAIRIGKAVNIKKCCNTFAGFPAPDPLLDSGSRSSRRSIHNAHTFRILLNLAVTGTHQCYFVNFCGCTLCTQL